MLKALYLGSVTVVGIINFLPVLGLLSAERIARGYGIEVNTPELEILLRHRALLFGILGSFVLSSLWNPEFRTAALVLAGASMLGFLVLTLSVGDYNPALRNILIADVLGIVALAAAFGFKAVAANT